MAADVPDLSTGLSTTRAVRRIAPDSIPDDDLSTIMWHGRWGTSAIWATDPDGTATLRASAPAGDCRGT